MKTNPRTSHCDTCDEDQAFVDAFIDQVDMLAGMALEMALEKPSLLLSPVMRRMLGDKAKEVKSMAGPLARKLRVDNPGTKPIEKWEQR